MAKNDLELFTIIDRMGKNSSVTFITDNFDNWIIAEYDCSKISKNYDLFIILRNVYFNNIKLSRPMYIRYSDIKTLRFTTEN